MACLHKILAIDAFSWIWESYWHLTAIVCCEVNRMDRCQNLYVRVNTAKAVRSLRWYFPRSIRRFTSLPEIFGDCNDNLHLMMIANSRQEEINGRGTSFMLDAKCLIDLNRMIRISWISLVTFFDEFIQNGTKRNLWHVTLMVGSPARQVSLLSALQRDAV